MGMGSTAVLFFHQSVSDDFRSHRGSFTPHQFRRLHQWQVRKTRRLLQGLPIRVFSQLEQQGSTFGERIVFCLKEIYRQGYDRILILGRDCAALQRKDLVEALALLQAGQACLGPDYRGGTYLMGLHLDTRAMDALSRVRWQTAGVLADLQRQFPEAVLLTAHRDIHEMEDVYRLEAESRSACRFLLRLLNRQPSLPSLAFYFRPIAVTLDRFYLRPPPQLEQIR